MQLCHPRLLEFVERDVFTGRCRQVILVLGSPRIGVNLVEHQQRRLVGTAQVSQSLFNDADLLFEIGMGDVDDMHQQVGLAHLVERTLEALNKVGRQLTDKADGIGQQEGQIVDGHLAYRSVKGGKQLVLGKHVTLAQQVHHGRLTHIGITHQSHTNQAATVLPLRRLLLVNLEQTLLQQRDAMKNDTAVHLQLGLTRTTQAN